MDLFISDEVSLAKAYRLGARLLAPRFKSMCLDFQYYGIVRTIAELDSS